MGKASAATLAKNSCTVSVLHLREAVAKEKTFDFLQERLIVAVFPRNFLILALFTGCSRQIRPNQRRGGQSHRVMPPPLITICCPYFKLIESHGGFKAP